MRALHGAGAQQQAAGSSHAAACGLHALAPRPCSHAPLRSPRPCAGKVGGTVVECAAVIELPDLKGRQKLGTDLPLYTLIDVEGE